MSIRAATQTAPPPAERLHLSSVHTSHADAFLRRLMDIILSSFALLLLLPFLALLALIIRIDSPGPVLFTQRRVGKDGGEFPFFKFRSMYADAEQRLDTLMNANDRTGPVFKMRRDPRITRVGRLAAPLIPGRSATASQYSARRNVPGRAASGPAPRSRALYAAPASSPMHHAGIDRAVAGFRPRRSFL